MPNYNTQGITSADPRNLGGSEGYGNPAASTSSGIMSNTSNPTANDDDNNDEPSFFESIANLFSGAGADLPSGGNNDDGDSGISFYDSPMFMPNDGGSDNDTTPQGGLPFETTAADRALYEALGVDVPEVYKGKMGEEEPEPNLDMDVLQDALQPEPIIVEELEVKAGDTLSAIAKDKGVSVQSVIDANPQIKNPDLIRPGEVVSVPDPRFEGVPKPRGVPDSPRLSDSTVTPTDTTPTDTTPTDTTPTVTTAEDTPVEIPSAAEIGTAPPAKDAGLMSKPLTAEERTSLSDMSDITKAQGKTITTNGDFSLPKLKSAVKGSIDNTKKQAMLEGIVDVEVGTAGPVTETSYSLSNLEDFTGEWRQRSITAGLLDARGNATPLARQLNSQGTLGDTIFDVQYAGRNGNGDLASGDGSAFKGRGLVQITGRRNYQEVQNRLQEQGINLDLINNPELVNDERYALPAAIAYLDYAGMTDAAAEEMSARKLQVIINAQAPVATAEERWEAAITALREEDPAAADEMEKRNEYEAQRTVGTTVDGMIGTNSVNAMTEWLQEQGVAIPASATNMNLVVLVNENS